MMKRRNKFDEKGERAYFGASYKPTEQNIFHSSPGDGL